MRNLKIQVWNPSVLTNDIFGLPVIFRVTSNIVLNPSVAEGKDLRFFVAALLRMTGIFILLETLGPSQGENWGEDEFLQQAHNGPF